MTPTRTPIATQSAALGLALAAGLFVLLFFSPRFLLWRSLSVPEVWMAPESLRAVDALKQLESPLRRSDHSANRVLRWRVLFPVIWHMTGLPADWYLALPFVGCLLTLWFILSLVFQRTGSWWLAWWTTVLLGASPWFFVSTGWLTYLDSWLMLGILAACFCRRRWVVWAAFALTPWIDERMVIAAPLCLAVRLIDAKLAAAPGDETWRARYRVEAIGAAAITGVIVAIRLGLPFLIVDGDSSQYLSDRFNSEWLWHILPWVGPGAWEGLRLGWLAAAAAFVLLVRARVGWVYPAAAGLGLAAIAGVGFIIAADLSRNFTLAAPLALLGVLLLARESANGGASPQNVKRVGHLVAVVASANLLIPASHVIAGLKLPIRGLRAEIARYQSPPPLLDPRALAARGAEELAHGEASKAEATLTLSLRLDGNDAGTLALRSEARRRRGDLPGALTDAEGAVRHAGDGMGKARGLLARALALESMGRLDEARADASAAVLEAGADAGLKALCAALQERLRAAGGAATRPAR